MLSIRFSLRLIWTCCLLSGWVFAATASPDYRSMVIVDAATGAVLNTENPDFRTPPASVTKLMTFLIVQDAIRAGRIDLLTPVEVSAAASKMGGTQVWLKDGEIFPVSELLYALMVQSANDAAYALAERVAGSVDAFVNLMNARAAGLGMSHTQFRSPHGLPPRSRKDADGDLTTAADLAKLARELLLTTDILRYTQVEVRDFGPPVRDKPVVMRAHNHLLGKVDGLDGLKTGYTGSAGFCLAATAERNDRRVIVVLMGSPTAKVRDLHVAEFIEQGFGLVPTTSNFAKARAAAQPNGMTVVNPLPSPVAANRPTVVTPAKAPIATLIITPSGETKPTTPPPPEDRPRVTFEIPE